MRARDRFLQLVFGPELRVDPRVAEELLPPGVSVRSTRWIPAVGGIFGRMRGPAAAVTLGRTIVVHPEVRLTRRLLRHELEHVRQWRQDPLFALRYTAESLRVGYRENRYERLARAAEHESPTPRNPEPPA